MLTMFRKAEAFGVVIGAAQGLEAALEIIKRFKKAYERNQEQPEFLDRLRLELLNLNEQIDKIKKDKALGTSDVLATVERLKGPQERLVKWLKKVDRPGQKAGFINQLVNGNAERKKLEEILVDLTRVKVDIGLAINRVIGERTRIIEKGVAENGVGIREIKVILDDGPAKSSGQQNSPMQQRIHRRRGWSLFTVNFHKSLTETSRNPKLRLQRQRPLIKRNRRRPIQYCFRSRGLV
jgi:hypothetical protein